MKPTRLGCLTIPGIITLLLTLAAVTGISVVKGGALFSPGQLNAQSYGNQQLGGVSSHAAIPACHTCHAAPWEKAGMSEHCLACHQNVIQANQDFHPLMLAEAQVTRCFACHTDHHGPMASVTLARLDQFPHEKLGFSLRAHRQDYSGAPFACSGCHGRPFQVFDLNTCLDCHLEGQPDWLPSHRSAFGDACLGCHDGWESYGQTFDHNQAAFSLSGKHAGLDCTACHAEAHTIPDLQAAPQDCVSCHAQDEPHEGRFGSNCSTCHTAEGWEPAQFDHSLAAFPLTGAHLQVECARCHANEVYQGTPQDCYSCHVQDDHHQGQFGTDCAACHSTATWEGATFDHSLAAFQLTGAHLSAACEQCHSGGTFKGTPAVCSACHTEPGFHAGLFGAACADCHTTGGWLPADLTGPHSFPLRHGDAASCRDCHPSNLSGYTCYTCHNQAEIASKHREEGISNFEDCLRCHPTGQEGEGGGDD